MFRIIENLAVLLFVAFLLFAFIMPLTRTTISIIVFMVSIITIVMAIVTAREIINSYK